MSADQKFERLTITLPPDVLDWVKQKKKELETADRRVSVSISAIIADAVAEMRELDQSKFFKKSAQKKPSKPSKDAPIIQPEDHSDGGPSTHITGRSQKTG